MKIFESENNPPRGWDLVRLNWTFLNAVFDDASAVTAEYGLHQKSLVLLALLDLTDTPQGLAQQLRAPAPTVSHMLNDLEKKGLIERTMDSHDRRRFRLRRTETGDVALQAGIEAIDKAVQKRFGTLNEDEQEILRRAIPLIKRLACDEE